MTNPAMIDALSAAGAADTVLLALRRAALTLHALDPQDRAWLLERLPAARRLQLAPLLADLAELGIPADERLVREALAAVRPSTASPGAAGDAWETLARQSAGTMAQLLKQEPEGLVARLVALRAWPWAEALLQSLDGGARRRVEQAAHGPWSGGATVDAWLVDDLARRAVEHGAARRAASEGAA